MGLRHFVSLALVLSACSGQAATPVVIDSVASGRCRDAASPQEWAKLQSYPTEFALDYLRVRTTDPITVTSVELHDSHGLILVDASFVPGGGVGDGFRYGDTSAARSARSWSARASQPNAILTKANPEIAAGTDSAADSGVWQLVVGVQPTSSAGGSAAAVELTYQAAGRSHTLTGQASVRLAEHIAQC